MIDLSSDWKNDNGFWGAAFTILGMDLAAPFHEVMGVPAERPELLVKAVREAVIENRNDYLQNRPVGIFHVASRVISTELGIDFATALIRWGIGTFTDVGWRHADWIGWRIVFTHIRHQASRLDVVGSKTASAILTAYEEHLLRSDLTARVDEIRSRRMSSWDLDMFARHDMDFDDPAKFNPFTLMELTATLRSFQTFWTSWAGDVTGDQWTKLWKMGADLLAEEEIDLPAPLPDPGTMSSHVADLR